MMIDQTVWFYKELDLPCMPSNLLHEWEKLISDYLLEKPHVAYMKNNRDKDGYINYMNLPVTKIQGKQQNWLDVPGADAAYFPLTDSFMQWFRSDISATALRPRFSTFQPRNTKICYVPAHCDMIRHYALNYVYHPGGGHVRTIFFQERGQPVIRNTQAVLGDAVGGDYRNELVPICSIKIPTHTWHLLRTDIIHRVENIISPRVRITSDPDQAEVDRLQQFVVRVID